MKKVAGYPPFLIKCSKCNKEPGQPCKRWEGAQCACMDRVAAAIALFGKYKFEDGVYKVPDDTTGEN